MTLQELIKAHSPKVALQFSGGRDSLAMLLALRDCWPLFTVYYTNSGDIYPETRALVDNVALVVPNFVEIQGDSPGVREKHGWPSDLVHVSDGWQKLMKYEDDLQLSDRYSCCYKSIMLPMQERMRADGITLLLRGQRDEDVPRSLFEDGAQSEGMTLAYPLRAWTTQDVEQFLAGQGMPLPAFYAEGAKTASDCMRCTAWLEHDSSRYLAKAHPSVAREVGKKLREIRLVVERKSARYVKAEEELNV